MPFVPFLSIWLAWYLSLDILDSLLDILGSLLDVLLNIVGNVLGAFFLVELVHGDSGNLGETDETEEEVDGSEEIVLGLNDQAPPGPDETGASEGKVLGSRELLDGTGEIGDTGEDKSPLHDGSPEMDSLQANLTLPHALEPRLLLLLSAIGTLPPATASLVELLAESLLLSAKCLASVGTESGLAEDGARGAEDGVCGGGHDDNVCS